MAAHEPPSTPQAGAGWEHFSHVADVGVRGFGPTPAQAFEQAALAMTAAVTDPAAVRPLESVDIFCAAGDIEMLLAEWLNALIYEMATRKMLFSRFEVAIAGTGLKARAWGERVERTRHQPAAEVKGATLTALRVAEDPPGLWIAQCVVDV
jgi:tRNA nucleotidyltransferase (CCA-adding enzyme)